MYKHFFKRFFDLIISGIALLLIGWLLILIAIFFHFVNIGAGTFFFQEHPSKECFFLKSSERFNDAVMKSNVIPIFKHGSIR